MNALPLARLYHSCRRQAAHCAMGDVCKGLFRLLRDIECLPRTGAVWWSFVEQTVIEL